MLAITLLYKLGFMLCRRANRRRHCVSVQCVRLSVTHSISLWTCIILHTACESFTKFTT